MRKLALIVNLAVAIIATNSFAEEIITVDRDGNVDAVSIRPVSVQEIIDEINSMDSKAKDTQETIDAFERIKSDFEAKKAAAQANLIYLYGEGVPVPIEELNKIDPVAYPLPEPEPEPEGLIDLPTDENTVPVDLPDGGGINWDDVSYLSDDVMERICYDVQSTDCEAWKAGKIEDAKAQAMKESQEAQAVIVKVVVQQENTDGVVIKTYMESDDN